MMQTRKKGRISSNPIASDLKYEWMVMSLIEIRNTREY